MFSFATEFDLPIETALMSLQQPASTANLNPPPVAESQPLGVLTPTQNVVTADSSTERITRHSPAEAIDDAQVLWPMMPNETLTKLAHSFYPNSPILAQRFIQKSQRLSKALGVVIEPDKPFRHGQIIAIPNEKEVSALTHRIKKRDDLVSEQEQLQLSYQLKNALPAKSPIKKNNEHTIKSRLQQVPIALELPEINVPNVTIPTLLAPNLGSISDSFNRTWHNIRAKARDMWRTSEKTMMDWQAHAIGMSVQWNQQHAANILGNQQAQVALLASGLVLLGLLMWWLQRRYLQRKVALLNTIESTLVEPGFIEPTIGALPVGELNEQVEAHQTNFNAEIAQMPDVSNSAFQDTEPLLENLSVDTPLSEEAKPNATTTRQEQSS